MDQKDSKKIDFSRNLEQEWKQFESQIIQLKTRNQQLEDENRYLLELVLARTGDAERMSRTILQVTQRLMQEKNKHAILNDALLGHFIRTSFNRLHVTPKVLQRDPFRTVDPFYYQQYNSNEKRYLNRRQINRLKKDGILAGCVGPVCLEAQREYHHTTT